jgi:CBS domain containing-hemolysin-like protein
MEFFSLIVRAAGVVALVLLNGFFVAAEFAIVKVRGTQLELLSGKGTRRVKIAQHVTSHLDLYLSACQLGITMTSLGLGWLGEPFVAELIIPLLAPLGVTESALLHTIAFAVAFSIITYLHIVLGEQAPKWYAIQYPRRSALFVARPLHLFTRVLRPFIWLLNASAKGFLRLLGIQPHLEAEGVQSEEELRIVLSRGKILSGLGKAISLRAMELHDRTVREVMVPRTGVVFLSTERTLEENIATALENQFTRYPLCERDVDNVVGMIHLKDLFRLKGRQGAGAELLAIKREMLFVPESMPLERILTTFLAKRVLMAMAVDEYGGTAGLVTLENVLEEVVGEIRDEFDEEAAPFHKVSDQEFLVDGAMALHDFSSMFGIDPDTRDVVTVGGYIIHLLGRVPERGATVNLGMWHATVEQVEGKKVKTLRLQRPAGGIQ